MTNRVMISLISIILLCITIAQGREQLTQAMNFQHSLPMLMVYARLW
jgi:hypothetical protein